MKIKRKAKKGNKNQHFKKRKSKNRLMSKRKPKRSQINMMIKLMKKVAHLESR
jgi:hypothetical protein